MEKTNKGYPIIAFLCVAIIIPIICAGLILYVPVFQSGLLNFIVFGLQAIAPTLAAVVTVLFFGYGLKKFLKEKYVSNLNLKYCAVGFLTPMVLMIIAKAIIVLYQRESFTLATPSSIKLIIILWALIAEELGWRGFLQERIEQKTGVFLTPVIVGLIWGLWHFHYYVTGSMDVPFVLLIIGCILDSYGYFAVTKLAKGNVVPASIWHFSFNLFINLFLLNKVDNSGSNLSYLVMIIVCGLGSIGFFFYYISRKSLGKTK